MKAVLEIDGARSDYPEEIQDLEGLLGMVLKQRAARGEMIWTVKVDGEMYSEDYPHQARKVNLTQVTRVEVGTREEESLAREFLREEGKYWRQITRGLQASATLLRDPQKERDGYQLLASCLDTLQAIKSHGENVNRVLQIRPGATADGFSGDRFHSLSDQILAAQEKQDSRGVALIIEEQMLPILEDWRRETERGKGRPERFSANPA